MNSPVAKPTILCVDDEIDNLDALERLFRKKYNVLKADSGQKALDIIQRNGHEIAITLSDQRMPEMTGVQLLEHTLKVYPDMIRILITGFTDLESVIMAVNQGQIYRYITKPWDPVDLLNTVDRAVERFLLQKELNKKNQELELVNKELKSLDDAKSKFMILINHELKTPLTSMINFLSLLSESTLSEEQNLYVNRMQKSSEKLKQIIEDVLILMKAETNQIALDPQSLLVQDINLFINPENQKLISAKKLILSENVESLEFKADKALFALVFNKILHNACKFSPDASTVEIKGSKIGNFFEFKIVNTGTQIPEGALAKIFLPFYLEENIMNHSIGMGLGLSICDKLLKLHGTSLNVKNTESGVKVSFYFPLLLQ